ncbi:FecR family protein [Pseudomonas psychrophila]|uniref:FecR family protein n=1 Tax=Pseudomonas psychrophila TaxID=122355 RepID=A0ABY0VCL3_9PSED|nr:FecR domain-containing protein [Pseudomonas psychrophila]KAB0489295.1 DUF4880 domain-containing protein [Pseudomonas psychrophila]QIE30846.1 DUF4880 domain-containing protein [Pseudomonas psychrophila]WVI97388.1 FecR domain-containing protein [Pseudomonas psychrophila]SDU08190.1 FecR family protein [Pseudomonas psychrophila]
MTDNPNPIWETALDWLLLIQENPHDPELTERLNNWRASAPEHDAAYRKALKVWSLSGEALTLPAEAAPAPRAPRPPPRLSRRKRALVGAAVAASALLMWGPDWQAMQADYRSPAAEHRTVALSDGSQMLLDSNTLADIQFNPEQREVTLLRGQAFFSVKPDADRAFYVNAGDVRVRVTGTAFAVSLGENGVDVSVESGTVAVQTPQASASAMHLLGHGDQLHFTANDRHTRIVQLPIEQIAPWRQWQLVAVDQSLDDVIMQLRRYQPGLILLTDKALGQRRITAALNLRDPKSALQAAIVPLGGRLHDSVPYTLIVSAKP